MKSITKVRSLSSVAILSASCCMSSVTWSAQPVLEEVIVSAQKRSQNLQDVPVAVTQFNRADLQQSGIADVFDLQVNAPGLVVSANQTATTSNFSIRGVGTGGNNFGLESSVGLYVDGVYRARQSSMINNLVDVESVEVLRGPQGTLFGRNTPAGAVLVATAKPDHDNRGFVEATYGNYNLVSVNAASSLSVVPDVLAVRGTMFYSERDGWMDDINLGDNTINDRDRWGARLQAQWTPSADLDVRIIADWSELDETCCGTIVIEDNNQAYAESFGRIFFPNGSDSLLEANGGTFIAGNRQEDYVAAYNQLPESSNEDKGLSIEVNWHGGGDYVVTSITSWREFDSFDGIDADFTDLDGLLVSNNAAQSAFTQELRVAGSAGKTDYVVGAYYYQQDLDNVQVLEAGEHTYLFAGAEVDLPIPPAFFPADGSANTYTEQEHQAYALFGQLDYALRENLTLTFGLRYTYEDKEMDAVYTEDNYGLGFEFFDPLAARDNQSVGFDDENVSSTLKLSWYLSPNSLLYASYSTGYKAGGTNTDRIPETSDSAFDAELSTSYEAGAKLEFPERALRLNMAVYYTEFDDFQVGTFDGTSFNLQNAAVVEASGLETEMLWQATESLRVSAAYSYSKAEYDEFPAGNCWKATPFRGGIDPGGDGLLVPDSCDRAGGRVDAHSENYFVGTVRQQFRLSDVLSGYLYGEYVYVGDQMMESSNDPYELQDDYQLVNLRAGLLFENYDAELIVWGRNVTDEFYYGTNFDPPVQYGKLAGYAREPATYGITARKNF